MTEDAKAFWDTHCVDCSHDMHPMNVCSAIIGGDHNGPDYCPCALDYPALASAYQRSLAQVPAQEERLDVERLERAYANAEATVRARHSWGEPFWVVFAREYRALGALTDEGFAALPSEAVPEEPGS